MTIKFVSDKDKHERLVTAKSVEFEPENNVLVGYGCPAEKDGVIRLTGGHAFVMNDEGQTVGMYNLRPGPRQLQQ